MAKRRQGQKMNVPSQWRKGPRPDPTVIELLDQLSAAARRGQIRALAVVTVDPLLQTEPRHAGDMDNVKKHLLAGGLIEASQIVLKSE